MSTSKQRVLNHLFSAVGKGYKPETHELPVLEQFIYAICREGTTRDAANRAFAGLKQRFFDWNEVRVSLMREVADALASAVDEPETRAQRIIDFLQQVFEATFSFDLEPIVKKGLKQAAKQIERYKGADDYVVAWIIHQSLGGHAVPLDDDTIRCLRRLAVIDEGGKTDPETLRASVEHLVPKAKGQMFLDLISVVAQDFCFESDPNCPRCPMLSVCPTGQERKQTVVASGKKSR